MLSRKVEVTLVVCLLVLLTIATSGNAVDTTSQLVAHVDEILQANPLKAGEKVQMIKIAEDDTVSLYVVRFVEGNVVKKHFHKTHDETIYVTKGAGQLLVDDKWVDLKPGRSSFQPNGERYTLQETRETSHWFSLRFSRRP